MIANGPVDRLIAQWEERERHADEQQAAMHNTLLGAYWQGVRDQVSRDRQALADALAQGRPQTLRAALTDVQCFNCGGKLLEPDTSAYMLNKMKEESGVEDWRCPMCDQAKRLLAEGRPQDAPPDATMSDRIEALRRSLRDLEKASGAPPDAESRS